MTKARYTTRRGTPEAETALASIRQAVDKMYSVVYKLQEEAVITVLKHYYKGEVWIYFHYEWVRLFVEGNALRMKDEVGNEMNMLPYDYDDILDLLETGECYVYDPKTKRAVTNSSLRLNDSE